MIEKYFTFGQSQVHEFEGKTLDHDIVVNEVCHICGQPADLICAICGEYFCPKCSAPYNQFTQIDYDCCMRCGDSIRER
jgi:hypothetical protein